MEIDPDVFLKQAATKPILGLDTESTGLRVQDGTDYLTGISLSFKEGPLYFSKYFPFRHKTGENLSFDRYGPQIRRLINEKPTAVHNYKHDRNALRTIGIEHTGRVYNPLVMAHMLEEELFSKQLDFLCQRHLGVGKYRDEIKAWTTLMGWKDVPTSIMEPYAAVDAELHLKLYEYYITRIKDEEMEHLLPIEDDFEKLLADIEHRGIRTDLEFCKKQSDYGEERLWEIEQELGFSPSRPTQLCPFLLEDLGLPILKRSSRTGKPSFDKEVMAEYEEILEYTNNPGAKLVLEHRGWQKTVSTLYRAVLNLTSYDGRIRPNYKLHGTRTGRLSCEKPNLHQIPREGNKPWNGRAKEAFIADDGFIIIEFDQRNLELRLGTEYAEDEKLRAAFSSHERDVFNEMASELSMERQGCKTLTYTIQFGGGRTRIKHVFGVSDNKAEAILNNFHGSYPGFRRSSNLAQRLAENRGYVRYWTGRRRHLHRSDARKAFNSLCQGGGAEIIKRQGIRINNEICKKYGDDVRIVQTVHDCYWLEMRKGLEREVIPKVLNIMADLPQFKTKFEAAAHPVGGRL